MIRSVIGLAGYFWIYASPTKTVSHLIIANLRLSRLVWVPAQRTKMSDNKCKWNNCWTEMRCSQS